MVDVSVDGVTVVAPADVVGSLSVRPETNDVRLTETEGAVIAENIMTTRPDSNSHVVVHLPTAAEDPIVTVFDNDMSAVARWTSR